LPSSNSYPHKGKSIADAFPKIKTINYEGPDSKNPLSFKHYNAGEQVEGKTMQDHLRFASAFWHTMRGQGVEIFGWPAMVRPWEDGTNSLEMALRRVPVFFEFLEKVGIDHYCFHDRDVAPEGRNLRESNRNLDRVVKELKKFQKNTGKKVLWGTSCLFLQPRFLHGAATLPNIDAFIYAAETPSSEPAGSVRIFSSTTAI
jgi:xylose isomerase